MLSATALAGCGHPNAANIELRKQNADLRKQVTTLTQQRDTDAAKIRFFEQNRPTVAMLPEDRLDRLFTTHGLQLGKLTGELEGGADPKQRGLMVYAVPTDETGEVLKAAGSFTVEAFDLADAEHPLAGKWTFDVAQAKSLFRGQAFQYTYALPCQWTTFPKHDAITVKVTFVDELTGRTFDQQKVVKIKLNQ